MPSHTPKERKKREEEKKKNRSRNNDKEDKKDAKVKSAPRIEGLDETPRILGT